MPGGSSTPARKNGLRLSSLMRAIGHLGRSQWPPLDVDQYWPAGLLHDATRFAATPPPFSYGGPDRSAAEAALFFGRELTLENTVSYKTILVHVDARPRCAERIALAFTLASRFDAHLIALCALERSRIPSYALAEAGEVLLEIERRRRAETVRAAEAEFRAAERRAGGKAEWRVSNDDPAAALGVSARYADLVIAGQPEPEDPFGQAFAGELVLGAGRPVLFVPYAGRFPDAGKRVLVAWNASREAARAVRDALPLLARADAVQVVAFEPGGEHGETPGADIALYLARHGVRATAARDVAPGLDIGSRILSRAADAAADLIVMGAYGHSRLRELALGGATRTLLEAMTVPVLMAH
jgi:nucleotide-binding universal stress UspA family protein